MKKLFESEPMHRSRIAGRHGERLVERAPDKIRPGFCVSIQSEPSSIRYRTGEPPGLPMSMRTQWRKGFGFTCHSGNEDGLVGLVLESCPKVC
jgi:hypothetical protein